MPKEKDRSEYHVRSVQRALRILDCFSEHNPYLGVSEITILDGCPLEMTYPDVGADLGGTGASHLLG